MKRALPIVVAVTAALLLAVWVTGPDSVAPPSEVPRKPLPPTAGSAPAEPDEPTVAEPPPILLQSAATRESPNAVHGAVTGEVRSAADGTLIAGAELTFFGHGIAYSTLTNAKGRFVWSAPKVGRYTVISLVADGFVAFAPRLGESPLVVFARAQQQVDDVLLYLHPVAPSPPEEETKAFTGRFSGQVLDPDGAGIPDAEVRAVPSGPLQDMPSRTVTTDGEGQFEINGVADKPYLLTARAEGYAPAIGSASPGTRIELVLNTGAVLTGSVRDGRSGAPVTSFTVLIDGLGSRTTAVVDPDGEFYLSELRARKTFVRIAANGFGLSDPKPVELIAGEEAAVEFELKASTRVFGTVRDEDTGQPIADAQIFSEMRPPEEVSLTLAAAERSAADGSFSLSGLGTGRRTLSVRHPKYNTRLVSGLELTADDDFGPVEITMKPVDDGEEPKTDLVGIGAALRSAEDGLHIEMVVPEGGAGVAGLVEGDIITEIDGVATSGMSFGEAVELIRGEEDSALTLTVASADQAPRAVKVQRLRFQL
ncbi:MAG: carboxypeptidase regulatory-like domain-containing protein [Myxococcota bacterium]